MGSGSSDPGFLDLRNLDIPATVVGTLGNYELMEVIGRGGMGIVYRARQRGLNRDVAVKVLAMGAGATAEIKSRLTREAQLAAQLTHPNIVPVFEVGEHDGLPYYSMELVLSDDKSIAPSLADLVAKDPLPPKVAAYYAMVVAQAVDFAHRQGVLHRDLKPSNVLLGIDGCPRITDFGLATQLDAGADHSATSVGMGTPGYSPPEQVAGERDKVGARSDVYGVGGILYCLLTRSPPFQGATIPDILRQVMDSDPRPPKSLNSAVPRDLETICLKCLEKESTRRYENAALLAEDLRRYRDGEPIHARRAGAVERMGKWCRRRPLVATLSLLTVAFFLLGFLAVLSLLHRSEVHRRETEQAYTVLALNRAEEHLAKGEVGMMLAYLADVLRRDPFHRVAAQRAASTLAYGGPPRVIRLPLTNGYPIHAMGFNSKTSLLGIGNENGDLHLCDTRSGKIVRTIKHPGRVKSLDFDGEGRRVITVTGDQEIRLWDTTTGQLLRGPWRNATGRIVVGLSDSGLLGMTLSDDGAVTIWDATTATNLTVIRPSNDPVKTVTFLPGEKLLRTVSERGNIQDWSLVDGEPKGQKIAIGSVQELALSKNGSWLAADRGTDVAFFDLDRGGQEDRVVELGQEVQSLKLSQDGKVLAALLNDGSVHLLDRVGVRGVRKIPQGSQTAMMELSSDGTRFAAADYDGRVLQWETQSRLAPSVLLNEGRATLLAEFSPGDDLILEVGDSGQVSLHSVTNASIGVELGATKATLASRFSPKGNLLILPDTQGTVHVHARTQQWGRIQSFRHSRLVRTTAVTRDETWLATTEGRSVWISRLGLPEGPSRELRHDEHVVSADFHPNGRKIVTMTQDGTARVWDWENTNVLVKVDAEDDRRLLTAPFAQFCPSGDCVLTLSQGRPALWDSTSGISIPLMVEGLGPILAHAFSPDGRRLALALGDHTVRILTMYGHPSGPEILRTGGNSEILHFSGDGDLLLAQGDEGALGLWEVASGLPVTYPYRPVGKVVWASVSGDGRFLTVAGALGASLASTTRFSVPVPPFLPDLLEEIGGQSISGKSTGYAKGKLGGQTGSGPASASARQQDWMRFLAWFQSEEPDPAQWWHMPF